MREGGGFLRRVRATPGPFPTGGRGPAALGPLGRVQGIRRRAEGTALQFLPSPSSKSFNCLCRISYARDPSSVPPPHNDVLQGHSSRSARLYVRLWNRPEGAVMQTAKTYREYAA